MIQSNDDIFRLIVRERFDYDCFAFYLSKYNTTTKKQFNANFVEFEEYEEGQIIEPLLNLNRERIQSLFNELWHLGFCPKDGTGNSGHIQAMAYHLEDMRKLVFKNNK